MSKDFWHARARLSEYGNLMYARGLLAGQGETDNLLGLSNRLRMAVESDLNALDEATKVVPLVAAPKPAEAEMDVQRSCANCGHFSFAHEGYRGMCQVGHAFNSAHGCECSEFE